MKTADGQLDSPDQPPYSPEIESELDVSPTCDTADGQLESPNQGNTSASDPGTEAPLPDTEVSGPSLVDDTVANAVAIPDEIPVAPAPPKPKPKSSVSKKLCYILLQSIADHIFTSSRKSRMPTWQKLESDVSWLIEQFFIDPKQTKCAA